MQILMTGVDHTTAGITVRERFAMTTTEKQALRAQLAAMPGVEGCVLLGTCNRTELWVSCREGAAFDLPTVLCRRKALDAASYRAYFTSREGDAAISYLFEMASGLHSQIMGEDQILAQVKRAHSEAQEAGCCGSVLDVLFRSAVTGAKKVKSALSISTANASAVNFALQALQESGMDFSGKRCLVIGNGEMGKRAASELLARGARVTVTIRQYRSGIVEVVPGCRRINYDERYEILPSCDVVVSATSSPNTTLTHEKLSACGIRPGTVLLDLAVPRDIDPASASIPGVTLLDIDSIHVPHAEELEQQLAEARRLLREQQEKFCNWFACRDLLPEVDALGTRFAGEVSFRAGAALKQLPPTQRAEMEQALQEAAAKELKKWLFAIRDGAGADTLRTCLTALSEEETHG